MRKSTEEMNAGSAPNAGRDARETALKKKAKTSETRRDSELKWPCTLTHSQISVFTSW